jgi:hypothetical protein
MECRQHVVKEAVPMRRDSLDWLMLFGMYFGLLLVLGAGLRMIYVSGHRGPYGIERRAHPRPKGPMYHH